MKFVFQTSVNSLRQKVQAVIKQSCQKAGIDLELKSVTASVFFSSDVANPDTYGKFWCDMQMYTTTMTQPDAERFMDQYLTSQVSAKANKWAFRNISRWTSDEYDRLYAQAEIELDPAKRAALFIRLNDMPIKDNAIIPLISRPRVRGSNLKLVAPLTGWDLDFSQLQDWYREG
jgi:peptide/nickel transport system substrate-binding protein